MDAKKLAEQRATTPDHSKVPGHKEMLHYGLGYLGIISVWTLIGTFLTFYYTDVAGISAAAVGTMMLVVRLLDGVTDIGMGTLIDRTKSKHGKARPWVLWTAIPLGITTVLVFSVPDISDSGKIIYAYVTYISLILAYTAISIALKTLLGLMTQVQQGRSVINIYSGVFTMIATLVITVSAQPVASAIGGRLGWTLLALMISVIIVATSFIAFRATTERVGNHRNRQKNSIPFLIAYKALFSNKYWVIITLYCVVAYTLNALLAGAGLYYAQYILGNTSYFSIIGLALFVPTIVGFFFISRIVKRFGKRNIALAVSFIGMFGPLVKLIETSSLPVFLVGTIIQGFGLLPVIMVLYAMINDTAEYGEWKSGVRTEGLINSAASFGMKVGAGLGGAIIGWLLAFGGYVGASPAQSAMAIDMIIVLNIYLPLLLAILQTILLWMYRLDQQYTTIVLELKRRKGE
ncbi:MFS transporter [Shouchella shacheensis]|uniref:MFS transporter n=1 Tax=Shouchella shacheensis TaxID=1649580 RepID=UPI00073FD135|nr:glycoside-pentoside-hexuronide (GPH):cation symporter [Shouchella shacheensis]